MKAPRFSKDDVLSHDYLGDAVQSLVLDRYYDLMDGTWVYVTVDHAGNIYTFRDGLDDLTLLTNINFPKVER